MSIDCIEQHFEHALLNQCSEQGCTVNLRQIPNRVVLKGEKLVREGESICDCLFFPFENGKYTVALVKLKSKNVDVSLVVKQLTNGTRKAFEILSQCGIDAKNTRWYHFLYSKAIGSAAQKVLRDSKVSFEGRQFNIIRKRCGASLHEAIERLN